MATVYLAHDIKHDRRVAVKVLRPELAAALGSERFLREIKIAANLQHPHIVPLYDSGEADGFLYYVMPYVEGESLRERLDREGKLPVEDAVRLTDDVAAALSYAHDHGIVHRDVKPENIMLTGGEAVVADFGIARALQVAGGERLTGTGLAIGTPAYMSPEQAMGLEEVDARSDVYALGCVVYEMVGGRAPFEGTPPQALLARHAVDTVPGLRASDPAIPVYVERAVERALAKSPADRFQSASAFAEALESGVTTAPQPVHIGARRRRRWRLGATVLAVAAVVAVGWWGVEQFGGGGARAIQSLAVLPFDNLTGDPDQDYFVAGVHEMLTAELSKISALKVISRTSAMQYKGVQRPMPQIASELGVTGLIDGSVLREDDWVRITVQLIHGPSDGVLWTQSFDRELRGVLALYSDVARAITQEIGIAVTPEEERRLASARPVKPEAYEAYLKGIFYANQFRFEQGFAYLREAIAKDSTHPLPYASLAQALNTFGHGIAAAPTPGVMSEAKAAALKALELDETLAEAHAALAEMKIFYERDWPGAEQAVLRALELNPNMAATHLWYAWYLLLFGRKDEALAELKRAKELDPLTPFHVALVGWAYWVAGEDEAAINETQLSLDLYPDLPYALYVLGSVYAQNGRYEEAIVAHQKAVAISPFWSWGLGIAYALAGRKDEARAIAAEYEKGRPLPTGLSELIDRFARDHAGQEEGASVLKGYIRNAQGLTLIHPWGLAELYAALGETDKAFRWLEAGIEQRQFWMPWIGQHPSFRSLRRGRLYGIGGDDPRFMELLQRMNLPN